MELNLDLDAVRRQLDHEAFVHDPESECYVRRTYLGSVLNLAPSGKYYTAFANANVSDDEITADAAWQESLEIALEARGMELEVDPDDPCDLFVVEICEFDPTAVSAVA